MKHHNYPECECDGYEIIDLHDKKVPSWTLEENDWNQDPVEEIKTFTFSFLSDCKDERMGAKIELWFTETNADNWRKRVIDGSGVITGPIPSSES